jgi:lipopolysaccharide/colanic/teichoic acid biosynthesis glycosyltransferase
MSEEERKQLDNTYARTHSFFGDIVLILRTFPALTQKESV